MNTQDSNKKTGGKSAYEQKYEQKARKKVNRKSTLAILLSLFTLMFVLFAGATVSTNTNAATVKKQVRDAVTVEMDELMGTPPVQEILSAGTVDTEVIKQEIIDSLTGDVINKAVSKRQSLNASDVAAMEQRIRESLEGAIGSQLSDETVVAQLEQSLGLAEGDLFSEEWFMTMLTDVFSTTVEQTVIDVLQQELDYVYEDIDVLGQYVDENLNNIYNNIENQQIQIENIDTQITEIKSTLTTLATKEELNNTNIKLEALNTELTEYKAQTDLMLSYLESTMADQYDELRAAIDSNTVRIEELEKRTTDNMSDTQSQINNIINQFNEELGQTKSEFSDELNKTKDELNNKIDTNKDETDANIKELDDKINQKISESNEKSEGALEQTKDNLDDKIKQESQKQQDNLATVDEKLTGELADVDKQLTDEINQSNQQNKDNLNDASQQITNNLNQATTSLNQNINNLQANTLLNLSALNQLVNQTANKLSLNTEQLATVTTNNIGILEKYTQAKFDQTNRNLQTSTLILNNYIVEEVTKKFNDFAANVSLSFNGFRDNANLSFQQYFNDDGDEFGNHTVTIKDADGNDKVIPYDDGSVKGQVEYTDPTDGQRKVEVTGGLQNTMEFYFAQANDYLNQLGTVVVVEDWEPTSGTLRLTTKQYSPPTVTLPTFGAIPSTAIASVQLDPMNPINFDANGWLGQEITADPSNGIAGGLDTNADGRVDVGDLTSPVEQAETAKYDPDTTEIEQPSYAKNEYDAATQYDSPEYSSTDFESNSEDIRNSKTEFDKYGYALYKENSEEWAQAVVKQQERMEKQQETFNSNLADIQAEMEWNNTHNMELLRLQGEMYAATAEKQTAANDVKNEDKIISTYTNGITAADAAIKSATDDKAVKKNQTAKDAAQAIIDAQTILKDNYESLKAEAEIKKAEAQKKFEEAEAKEDEAKAAYDAEAAKTYVAVENE